MCKFSFHAISSINSNTPSAVSWFSTLLATLHYPCYYCSFSFLLSHEPFIAFCIACIVPELISSIVLLFYCVYVFFILPCCKEKFLMNCTEQSVPDSDHTLIPGGNQFNKLIYQKHQDCNGMESHLSLAQALDRQYSGCSVGRDPIL